MFNDITFLRRPSSLGFPKMPIVKTLLSVCATGALCSLVIANQRASAPDDSRQRLRSKVEPRFIESAPNHDSVNSRAHAHPHGNQVCASGCAKSNHPTPLLVKTRFVKLISQLTGQSSRQKAIDSLLYYGPQTKQRLRLTSNLQLSSHDRDLLEQELKRDFVHVEFRLTSSAGRVIASLPPTRVPFDIRHEFDLEEHDIPTLSASGTVKRVGQHRLWARL